jgi:S-adenosylmethionine:tRNA ribosyltransferase-isomerase
MLTADFDFELPDELIAQEPLERGSSRLMYVPAAEAIRDVAIRDLPRLLRPGDLLVVNNTSVLKARIHGRLSTGGRIEVLLAERQQPCLWDCLVRPGRKARPGTVITFSDELKATVLGRGPDGRFRLEFSSPPTEHLETIGHVPLPPYIKRADTATDVDRYQTVFASRPGAIAAPTAGLHFDPGILESLQELGIGLVELTLHVGIGTFKPVTAELVHEHRMDPERFEITQKCAHAIRQARDSGGRIVAVGTTVVRTLEAVAFQHQGTVVAGHGSTDLFIAPGFRFRVVDLLLTNFHLPRSTLLMLVSAFAGHDRVLEAYGHAVRKGYRFYSYGDAMLLERQS